VIKVTTGRLDSDIVGRQPDVGVEGDVVLLDVRLDIVGVGDRSEMWCQRGDHHVVAAVADLSFDIVLCCSHNLDLG
jgi:hypothetical protein